MSAFDSVVHEIVRIARAWPARDALIVLERGEDETARLSYGELLKRTDALAAGLSRFGLAGRPVAVALPTGADFPAVFLACLRMGAIAVPVPFPEPGNARQRLAAILADANPAAVVTNGPGAGRLAEICDAGLITTVDVLAGAGAKAAGDFPPADAPALIQYTSGSTREPKGVVITHGNLNANTRMIGEAFSRDLPVCVTWLPHFHDMGLIGTMLQPLSLGTTVVAMPPRAFVQKPLRWLRALEKYRGVAAGGPCFGYELCVRTIADADAARLDLSSWRVAFCGAERVRPGVLERFAAKFGAAGFRRDSFLPCYGLAEATLLAASQRAGAGYSDVALTDAGGAHAAQRYVSCGRAATGGTIVLRDGDRIIDGAGGRGEICVAGPHVSPGHWDGRGGAVAPFAQAFIHRGMRFLPTGDIGALVNGELVPIDRISDTIILYGTKIHAADMEAAVMEQAEEFGLHAAVAFAVDDGAREQAVVLCERGRRPGRVGAADALAAAVAAAFGVVPIVGLVPHGSLPRTSSGKLQRHAARTRYLSGAFGASRPAPVPSNPAEIERHAE